MNLFISKFKESGALDVCLHQIQVYADTVLNSTTLKKYPYLYQMAERWYLALHPIEELNSMTTHEISRDHDVVHQAKACINNLS